MIEQRTNIFGWIEVEGFSQVIAQFPDGSFRLTLEQSQPRFGEYISGNYIVRLKSTLPEAIMLAGQAIDILKGREETGQEKITLVVQTMPDQRADRSEVPGMSVPARVTAYMLASLGADEIVVHDVHSSASILYLKQAVAGTDAILTVVSPLSCFNWALKRPHFSAPGYQIAIPTPTSKDYIVQVDEGARNRADNIRNAYDCAGIIVMEKARDNKGRIIGHKVLGWKERGDSLEIRDISDICLTNLNRLWIVDDICDGGATFISAAKAIEGFPNLVKASKELYVTHGLFSLGKADLSRYFTHIISLFDYSKEETKNA